MYKYVHQPTHPPPTPNLQSRPQRNLKDHNLNKSKWRYTTWECFLRRFILSGQLVIEKKIVKDYSLYIPMEKFDPIVAITIHPPPGDYDLNKRDSTLYDASTQISAVFWPINFWKKCFSFYKFCNRLTHCCRPSLIPGIMIWTNLESTLHEDAST